MKDNQKKLLKDTLVCICLLAAYYVFIRLTGVCIPCVFRKVTGLKCPGCGLTAMCMYIIQFRFADAFHANPLMFVLSPFLAAALIVKIFFDPVWLGSKSKAYNITVWILLGITFAFGVVRNIAGI